MTNDTDEGCKGSPVVSENVPGVFTITCPDCGDTWCCNKA